MKVSKAYVMDRDSMRAFTLIEVLLVLIIIGLLAGFVGGNVGSIFLQSKDAAAKTQLGAIAIALDNYMLSLGQYPTTEDGLTALVINPYSGDKDNTWNGPYFDKIEVPLDPWSRQYIYLYPGTHNYHKYDLYSLGADGRQSDDDIVNWADSNDI